MNVFPSNNVCIYRILGLPEHPWIKWEDHILTWYKFSQEISFSIVGRSLSDETEAVQKAVANNGSGFSVAHLRSQIAGFYAELRNTSQAERRALADTLPKMAAIIMRKCLLYNIMCVPTGVDGVMLRRRVAERMRGIKLRVTGSITYPY